VYLASRREVEWSWEARLFFLQIIAKQEQIAWCIGNGRVELQPPLSPFGGAAPESERIAPAEEEISEKLEVELVRPEYLQDLERAEAAERDLATGRGFIDSESGEAPSDPVDNLRRHSSISNGARLVGSDRILLLKISDILMM
jgi:hypothetical protein